MENENCFSSSFISRTNVALLDEPTNHLDLYAVIWLTEYLKQLSNVLVLVSHDQHFMDDVCTDIIHCHDQQLVYYPHCTWNQFRHKFQTSVEQARSSYVKTLKKMTRVNINKEEQKTQLKRPEKDYEWFEFSVPSKISGTNLIEVDNVVSGTNQKECCFAI